MLPAPSLLMLLITCGGFALTILLYFETSALYRSPKLPHWLGGEVVPQMICVGLTGALVGTVIGIYTAAGSLPFGVVGDASSATGALIASALIGYAVYKGLAYMVRPRLQA